MNKKWLAGFDQKNYMKYCRQLQLICYLSLMLNGIFLVVFLLMIVFGGK